MKPPLKLSSAVFGDEEEEDSMSTSGKAAAPQVSFKPKTSSLESVSCETILQKKILPSKKLYYHFTPLILFYIIVVFS